MRWYVFVAWVCMVQVVIGTRSKRLVIAQGRDGVGEVLRVDEQEYERLISQGVKVVRGEVVANATEKSLDNVEGNVEEEEEHEEDEVEEFGNATAVAVPEDVMRGGNVDRKVPGKHEPPGADLSFTGLLNGLLDSFINEPPSPPSRPQPPSPPSPPTTPASLEENSNQDDEEEDELLEEEQEIPEHNQQEISNEDVPEDTEQESDDAPSPPPRNNSKACAGECRNIIFGLFLCDEIDNDSYCPESLACCVNNAPPSPPNYNRPINTSSEEDSIVLDNNHDLPEIELPPDTVEEQDDEEEEDEPTKVNNEPARLPAPPPPPPPQQQMYMFNRPPPFRNPQPPPHMYYPNKHVMPPPQLQKLPYAPCPRYCVKNFLEQHCPHRLPSNFACGVDAFCCESNVVEPPKEEVLEEEPEIEEQTGTKVLGPCTEEVGSCVNVHVISIICFAHATPTDMYTCPRSSMKCCARKTALPKDATPAPPTTQQPITNSITRNASSIIPKQPLPPPPQLMTPQQPATFPQQIAPNAPPQPPALAETPPPLTLPSYGTSQRTRTPIAQYVCGVKGPGAQTKRRRKRVVGGRDSLPGEWCWQVALINSLNQYLCGGALIGTQWVLTAAHCVTNIVRSGDAIYVRVGDHDLTSRYGSPGAQTLRVATTYIHHNHNSQTLDNDIALLKLQGNAALKEGVCLVCLPSRTQNEVPGKRCTVTGYGYMGESGPIPLRIREALLPIVSDDECVKKVNAVTEKVFALPMSSFCAGGDQSGHDACQGDGGGPLVCTSGDDRAPGYYELTGLVSWGFGCGRENVPGVYVKVSSFIGWIHQIIRSN